MKGCFSFKDTGAAHQSHTGTWNSHAFDRTTPAITKYGGCGLKAAAVATFSSHPDTVQAAVTLPSTQEATIYNLSEYRSILLNIQTSLRHVQYGKFYWV